MFESLNESLRLWNKNNDDRAKLQHAYLTVVVTLVVIAGLVSLLNVSLGQSLLGYALAIGAVLIVNAIAWALLQSFVLTRLGSTSRRTATTAATTRTKKR